MIQLIYVSSANVTFSNQELKELLIESRSNNLVNDITGILLYKDGNFMQVLEGEERVINSTLLKISGDRRHKGMITLLREPVSERSFPDWSMGFGNLNDAGLESLPGYNDFLNSSMLSAEFTNDPDSCRKLLLSFKQHMH